MNANIPDRLVVRAILGKLKLEDDIHTMILRSRDQLEAGNQGLIPYCIFLPRVLRSCTREELRFAINLKMRSSRDLQSVYVPGPFRSRDFKMPGVLPGWIVVQASVEQ